MSTSRKKFLKLIGTTIGTSIVGGISVAKALPKSSDLWRTRFNEDDASSREISAEEVRTPLIIDSIVNDIINKKSIARKKLQYNEMRRGQINTHGKSEYAIGYVIQEDGQKIESIRRGELIFPPEFLVHASSRYQMSDTPEKLAKKLAKEICDKEYALYQKLKKALPDYKKGYFDIRIKPTVTKNASEFTLVEMIAMTIIG